MGIGDATYIYHLYLGLGGLALRTTNKWPYEMVERHKLSNIKRVLHIPLNNV